MSHLKFSNRFSQFCGHLKILHLSHTAHLCVLNCLQEKKNGGYFSIQNIQLAVFITKTVGVYCSVRTEIFRCASEYEGKGEEVKHNY